MIEAILFTIAVVCAAAAGYLIGNSVGDDALKRAKAALVTERAVRHNLNCLASDLKHDVKSKSLAVISLREEGKRLDGLLHEQNVKVLELRNSLKVERDSSKVARADALAFNSLRGQWVTDMKHLVEYNVRKDCFRCIGFPERRL